jgi:hypothetical protein
MKMKQTAVEWLVNEMPVIDWQVLYWKIKLDKAKAMEKEQMVDFVIKWMGEDDRKDDIIKHYNETFNTNEK